MLPRGAGKRRPAPSPKNSSGWAAPSWKATRWASSCTSSLASWSWGAAPPPRHPMQIEVSLLGPDGRWAWVPATMVPDLIRDGWLTAEEILPSLYQEGDSLGPAS